MYVAKVILLIVYAVAPLAAIGHVVWYRRRGLKPLVTGISSTLGMAVALGASLNFLYAMMAGASVRIGQVVLTSYFLLSLVLLLRGFSWVLDRGFRRLLGVGRSRDGIGQRGVGVAVRVMVAGLLRAALLIGLGLPLIMASVMTYRPKVALSDNPKGQLGVRYETVNFTAVDGSAVEGWWMPAGRPTDETVVVCHGLGANKSNQIALAAHFIQAGFNVLIFDFRAHGHSGGQVSSFGDRERYDVLGAVRWLRVQKPGQSRRLYGVGASMGAAALIAAAADDSDEGRAIDALAVYGTYDSLAGLTGDVADARFIGPLRWLVKHVSLPLASLHAGTPLALFSPARLVDRVAPRPIMFVHGMNDEIIPFTRGRALFNAASQPKYHLWLRRGDHNSIINDTATGKIVAEFFRRARPML